VRFLRRANPERFEFEYAVGKDGPCLERYEEAALKAHRLPSLNPTSFSENTGPGTKGAREA
jgi:hypothetical protein